jgi:hypothetical protein
LIDLDATVGQQLFDVAVGQAVAPAPAHRYREHVGWNPEAREADDEYQR